MSLIRDAEIEQALRDYSTPIFESAGLSPHAVKIYIINDKSINAFVAGGQNMFLNTGLITRSKSANMVIGVIAHETGHIAGGHIVKRHQELENLSVQTVLSAVLGTAVAVAGLPDAGTAILAGGQHVSGRNFLSYTREQEVAADQASLNYLKDTDQSAQGLLDLMQILRRDQTLNFDKIDPYAITHPLTQQRVAHIRSNVTKEEETTSTEEFDEIHERIVAKLEGFIEKPEYVFSVYKDNSIPSLYARSIAYYRMSDLKNSFKELDQLIAKYPNDPFFNELKGQILFENGRVKDALPYYKKAVSLLPNSALLNHDLGKVYLNNNEIEDAISYLQKAAKIEPQNSLTWRLLATSYGNIDNKGMLNLTLAEEANILGNRSKALNYAKSAKKILEKDSAGWLRANDLIREIKLKKKKENG